MSVSLHRQHEAMCKEQCTDGDVCDGRCDHARLRLHRVLAPGYARDERAESENKLNDQQSEYRNGCSANGLDGGETDQAANGGKEKNKSCDARADQVWKKMHAA